MPRTLRGYRASWLSADLLAGLTLVAVALPSQMATARLANLPAVAGLDAFVAGSVLYALVGGNGHVSVGADSTIAPVLAAGVATVAAVGTAAYGGVMALTALLVGGILVAAGLLRLGWISELLSTPAITGILAGIAVAIVVRQLPVVLGLAGGGTTTIGRIRHVVDQAATVNGWSVGISAGVLAVIVAGQRVDRRFPGALVGLILSILAVETLHLGSRHGVVVLGPIHGGLPHVGLPAASLADVRHLVGPILTVAFVCVAQTAATVRQSSGAAPAADDFNRDLIGVGAGSIAAGLIGTFAVDASPPNTAITAASGGRTQVANLLSAGIVAVVVLAVTAPLAHLPEATLGATLIFVASRLFRFGELRTILRFDRGEFALAAATLLVVALVGIQPGVALALIISLADRTRRAARPRDAILGRKPGTDHWIPVDVGETTEQVAGILVYLVYAPVWYGNADFLRLRIRHLIDEAQARVRAVVLDANAMSDIDYTGIAALQDLHAELETRGVSIEIARASQLVHHDLKHSELLRRLGPDHLFESVDEAVAAVQKRPLGGRS